MTEIEDRFEINVSLKKSWSLLSDLSGIEHYLPGLKQVTFEGQKRKGLGVIRISEYHSGTILKERVLAWEDQHHIRFDIDFVRGNPPPVDSISHEWRIAAAEDATILSSLIRYTPKYDVIGRMIDSVHLRRQIERAYRNTCLAFKFFLESGQLVSQTDLLSMREAHTK